MANMRRARAAELKRRIAGSKRFGEVMGRQGIIDQDPVAVAPC